MADLFAAADAREAKDRAMAQSAATADASWKAKALEMVRLTCLEQLYFTADDVFERLEALPNAPTTHDTRAFGPVMTQAAKLGHCDKTDRVQNSRRPSCHHRPLAIWRSNIYRRG